MPNRFTTIGLDQVANRSQHDKGPWENIIAHGVAALPTACKLSGASPFNSSRRDRTMKTTWWSSGITPPWSRSKSVLGWPFPDVLSTVN